MKKNRKHQVQYRPREFAQADLQIDYGFHPSPFGQCLVMVAQEAILGLAFVEKGQTEKDQNAVFQDMRARWPQAIYHHAPRKTAPFAKQAFAKRACDNRKPPLLLIGSDFQKKVWKELLALPYGQTTNYGALAAKLGSPQAARAVGRAVGQNPISWLVPCHLVLRRDGGLGGYHWGLNIKQKMLSA